MGRPLKQGLDYFPLDIDFFQNIKVRKITKAQGIQSTPVLICLLSNIYRQDGYYLRWDGDMPYLIAEECGTGEGGCNEVLSQALKVGFFDAGIYETYGVLTSRGIQETFFTAVKTAKRKKVTVIEEFLLIDPLEVPKTAVWCHAISVYKNGKNSFEIVNSGRNSINSGINSVNSGINPQRESEIEKESEREKEREREIESESEKKGNPDTNSFPPVLDEIRDFCMRERLDVDAGKFYKYYSLQEWKDARGRPVNWRQKAMTWDAHNKPADKPLGKENPQIAMARRAVEMIRERGEKSGQ